MNQTALIVLGVSVFAMTVVAVLIYFYSLLNGFANADELAVANATLGVTDTDA